MPGRRIGTSPLVRLEYLREHYLFGGWKIRAGANALSKKTAKARGSPRKAPHLTVRTFEEFCGWLFAFRAALYVDEWREENAESTSQQRSATSKELSLKELRELNRGRPGVKGPDSAWGCRHFFGVRKDGSAYIDHLREAYKALGTIKNRTRTITLIHAAFSEACREKERKGRRTHTERKTKYDQLIQARRKVHDLARSLDTQLVTYVKATRAVAPHARMTLSFPAFPEAQREVLRVECDNPAEIELCREELQSIIERLTAIDDYNPVPKVGSGRLQKRALNDALVEVVELYKQREFPQRRAVVHTYHLLYVAGITSDKKPHGLEGKYHQLPTSRRS